MGLDGERGIMRGVNGSADDGQRVLITRDARLMAADIAIRIAAAPHDAPAAERAAGACVAWLAEVAGRLTRFDPDSELSRLNASSGEDFAASELLFAAVARALAAARATGGLFDPTLLPQLEALGYDRDFSLIAHQNLPLPLPLPPLPAAPTLPAPTSPPASERTDTSSPVSPASSVVSSALSDLSEPSVSSVSSVVKSSSSVSSVSSVVQSESLAPPATWRDITLDPHTRRIRLPRGLRLDLGGIAKGWAADVALERYCAAFPGALVNVGGDLRLRGGPAPGEAWSVGIADPRAESAGGAAPTHAALVTFSRGALATSGSVRRWWLRAGRRAHHLLDPRTRQPIPLWIDAQDDAARDAAGNPLLATATALAPTAARAEVAAKLALLRGYPAALAAVESTESAVSRSRSITPGDGTTAADDPDAAVALVLVLGTGEVKLSANMNDWLATWGTADSPIPIYIR